MAEANTSVKRTREVVGNSVVAQLVTKKDKNQAVGITCNWTLDFSNCSNSEILELASRAVIIGEQAIMRAHSNPSELAKQDILVRDFLDRERAPIGPLTADRAMKKLSIEEKQKMLEALQAELGE